MSPLRYVVLRHEGVIPPHYDLMFETAAGSKLATWRSEIWPINRPVSLERLGDHRRDYLEYEGPLSGDRGFVRRVTSGTCCLQMSKTKWRIQLDDRSAIVLELLSDPLWRASISRA